MFQYLFFSVLFSGKKVSAEGENDVKRGVYPYMVREEIFCFCIICFKNDLLFQLSTPSDKTFSWNMTVQQLEGQ